MTKNSLLFPSFWLQTGSKMYVTALKKILHNTQNTHKKDTVRYSNGSFYLPLDLSHSFDMLSYFDDMCPATLPLSTAIVLIPNTNYLRTIHEIHKKLA